jgi:hypothetical protein
MARYQIRLQGPGDARSVVWDMERADDAAALESALEVCQTQWAEVWEGERKIANIALSVEPRLTL